MNGSVIIENMITWVEGKIGNSEQEDIHYRKNHQDKTAEYDKAVSSLG